MRANGTTALVTGALTKTVDLAADEHIKLPLKLEYLGGLIYGLLFGYIAANTSLLVSSLWLGLGIGVVVSLKIDHPAHMVSLIPFSIMVAVLGLPAFYLPFILLFTFFTASDEIIEERVNKRGLGLLKKFLGLELVCLIASILTGVWLIFLSILAFDAAYIAVTLLGKKRLPGA